jgi:two-component system, chemotaxis family, protein-glutamate methylesterase/glutaminase
MIFVGGSFGGLRALTKILSGLPRDFAIPLAVVLHRHKDSDGMLLEMLQKDCPIPASEPVDKEPVVPNHVYLAPADYHLMVEGDHFALSVDDPVRYARPSVDVLFESGADAFGADAIAIILTGSNRDGVSGAVRIRERGGRVIVQDPATCEAPQMPQGVLDEMKPDHILCVEEMARILIQDARETK